MTRYIRLAFKEDILEKLDWMDQQTKKRAQLKLEKMEQSIAYSDEFLNKDIVDNLHRGLYWSKLVMREKNLNDTSSFKILRPR